MIPLIEINTAAEKYQVPAETIEKDYVISWILYLLSKSDLKNNFVFYGGTAIKRMYFEDHRFSEDIDLFSTQLFSKEYLLQELGILKNAKADANLILEVDSDSLTYVDNRFLLFIRYSGYEEITSTPKQVRIDFSMNMQPFGNIIDKKIIKSYSDLEIRTESLSTMTLNTIFANKLGLILDRTRNEPRDVFDIWFLLQKVSEFNFDFSSICKTFNEKYGFYPSFSILRSHLNNQSLKQLWDTRLRKQVAALPDVGSVVKDVTQKLNCIFKSA